jgi:hypothetical protein
VATVLDGGVGLPLTAGDQLLHISIHPGCDRVGIAEGCEKGFLPLGQHFPGRPVGCGGRVFRRGGYQGGKLAGALLVRFVREGRVVAALYFRVEFRGGGSIDDGRHGKLGHLLGKCSPVHKGLSQVVVSGGQHGIGRNHPGEATGILCHQAQTDQPPPVLAHQGDVIQL